LTLSESRGFVALGAEARRPGLRRDQIDTKDPTMKLTLTAPTGGRMAAAGAARRRVGAAAAHTGGLDLGMYPCVWRAGNPVSTIHGSIFATATSHKAWRPKESSP
jgi:hypothetical protein